MKYYDKQPLIGYIALPIIGAMLALIVVYPLCGLCIYVITEHDVTGIEKAVIFSADYIFFLSWFIHANRHRDYIELSPGLINFVYDKRRNKDSIPIKTDDILLLEILTMYEPPADQHYRVYTTGLADKKPDNFIPFDNYQVPVNDLLQFCRENNINALQKKIRDLDIETITLKKERITITYHSNWIPKRTRIPVTDISNIAYVSADPVSMTDDFYRVYAHSGIKYEFAAYYIKREKMSLYCAVRGLSLVDEERNEIKTIN